MQNIQNKTAIITGGTKGIGYGIAEAMLREDMNVLITGRSDSSVNSALSKLRDIGKGKVEGQAADVRNLSAMKAAVDAAAKHFGGLDILIANAGIGHFGSIEEITEEQWRETIDVNLTGVFNSVKASLDKLKASDSPYLITIASLAGTNFFAGGSAYNASKFGLVGFTQAMMLDLRHKGINVSTIMPGSVATHFNDRTPTKADSWKIQPEDLGKMVIDLLKMDPRTLPSKIEVRPSRPPKS
jgi:3-oxoacyl-[acyl-carrier protein] reductase